MTRDDYKVIVRMRLDSEKIATTHATELKRSLQEEEHHHMFDG